MRQLFLTCLVLSLVFGSVARVDAENADMTVRTADDILIEQTQMTGKRIPESLLAEAQGVAIIPDVIKIGFVAAVRRGHGVVLVRDANGAWTLPQFITITGGSVGWQAGIQGTDVVLVFMTKKSVQGLLKGKFTIGADASAAAGPVGRNAAAATDARLQAEILSYSRSRGLFAGVSLDGSVIEMNPATQSVYYDAPVGQPPVRVPESALKLVQDLTQLSSATRVAPPTVAQPAVAPSPDTSLQPVPQPAPVASGAINWPWPRPSSTAWSTSSGVPTWRCPERCTKAPTRHRWLRCKTRWRSTTASCNRRATAPSPRGRNSNRCTACCGST